MDRSQDIGKFDLNITAAEDSIDVQSKLLPSALVVVDPCKEAMWKKRYVKTTNLVACGARICVRAKNLCYFLEI